MGLFSTGKGEYVYVLYEENEDNIIEYSKHREVLVEMGELLHGIDPTSEFRIHKLYEITPKDIKLGRKKASEF